MFNVLCNVNTKWINDNAFMIYLLDLFLIFNLLIVYNVFKDCFAPPFLVGIGMLAASFVATCYYSEWQMNTMLPSTFIAIGGGTFAYTFAALLAREKKVVRLNVKSIPSLNFNRTKKCLLFIVLLSFINCLIKFKYYQQTFGFSLSFSELIYAARLDSWTGDRLLKFPKIVYYISYISDFYLYISLWLLSYMIIFKIKNKTLRYLTILHLILVMMNGMLSGAKGAIISPIFRFISIYILLYSLIHGLGKIKRAVWVKVFAVFIIFIIGFKSVSTFIGRQTEDTNNTSMLAEYCGAEIKNLDIYMHGRDGNSRSQRFGEYTFMNFYKEIQPNFKKDNGKFQSIGNYDLGNVYTQYFQFHMDFGMIGVFAMSALLSFLSMYIYNRSKRRSDKINFSLLVYASVAFPILMSFFSSQFTELVFTPYFLKFLVVTFVLVKLTNKYLIKGKFIYE